MNSQSDLLETVLSRSRAELDSCAAARAFLSREGTDAEAIWRSYRIGATGPGLAASLSNEDRERLIQVGLHRGTGVSQLSATGILVPTFDPQQPGKPVGLVKITPAQNIHRFIGSPAGLALPGDLDDDGRVILVDGPLLMLRLAHHGARNVVLAESPEVLKPLADWLKGREIVLAFYRQSGLEALGGALKTLGVPFIPAHIHCDLHRTGVRTLALLGIERQSIPQSEPPKADSDTAALLAKFARQRVLDGHGYDLLRKLGADDPSFLDTFQVGFLPKDFRKALPKELRGVRGLACNAIAIPAHDERGQVVDLLLHHLQGNTSRTHGVLDEPAGLIGWKVATVFNEIAVVDSIRVAARFFKVGVQNVILFRDAADATRNGKRLLDAGVLKVTVAVRRERDAEALAEPLKRTGLEVQHVGLPKTLEGICPVWMERVGLAGGSTAQPSAPVPVAVESSPPSVETHGLPPAMPPDELPGDLPTFPESPVLDSHDTRMMRAVFSAGNAHYEVETAFDCGAKLEVTVERDGKKHRDRFDLSKEAQRRRFATSGAMRTGVPFEVIDAHLIALLDAVRGLQEEMLNPATAAKKTESPQMSDAECAEALALLKSPDLLNRIAADLEALGWVGESRLKELLPLIAVSRKLPDPLHGAFRSASGSGKTQAMEALASITPPEDLVKLSKLTNAALFHQGDGLRHKLLLLSESDVLEREVIVQLRVLLSEGALRKAGTVRDPVTGMIAAEFHEAKGPVAFLTSTTQDLDAEILDRCYDLPLDESEEQTKRILEAQRRASADPGIQTERDRIVTRLRNVQRLIEPAAVKIPWAARIEFPAQSLRHRREHQRFLRLIQASALLHQHQRLKDGEYVVADERDFKLAKRLAAPFVEVAADEFSRNARDVLAVIRAAGLKGKFCLNDLKALKPSWTRHKLYSGLEELTRTEILTSSRGRGAVRKYTLQATGAGSQGGTIRLLSEGELSELSKGADNNFTPATATG